MNGRQGSVVIEDVASGRILASYKYEIALRREAAPGSAIKPFILRELLESGKVKKDEAVVCRRHVTIGDRQFDCVHGYVDHALSPAEALAYSCNWYFTRMGMRLSESELSHAIAASGSLPTVHNSPSHSANPDMEILALLGEGVHTTPLRLLESYRTLAMLRGSNKQDPFLEPVFAGMEGATEFGTARTADGSALAIAGKTGTSKADEGNWTHGWFVGYTPIDKPRIAIVVFLERGHGSDAAEIARSVLKKVAEASK